MPRLQPSEFCTYSLSSEEYKQVAEALSNQTLRAFMQQQLSEIASTVMSLTYDPSKPMEWMQQNAYQRGQLDMLKYLLNYQVSTEE